MSLFPLFYQTDWTFEFEEDIFREKLRRKIAFCVVREENFFYKFSGFGWGSALNLFPLLLYSFYGLFCFPFIVILLCFSLWGFEVLLVFPRKSLDQRVPSHRHHINPPLTLSTSLCHQQHCNCHCPCHCHWDLALLSFAFHHQFGLKSCLCFFAGGKCYITCMFHKFVCINLSVYYMHGRRTIRKGPQES